MRITQILTTITLASLPLYVVRCNNFSWCVSPIPFTLLEVLIVASFASWAIWRLYQVKSGVISARGLFERLRGPFFWPLVLFLIISTLAMFVSPDPKAAAGIWKAYFIEPALLFIVTLDISLEKRSINWVLYPLILSGIWLSVYAISQEITKADPFAPDSISLGRVTGVYNNPNALGLYLGPLLAIGLGFLIETCKKKKAGLRKTSVILFLVASIVIFLAAIYLSGSRGAGIGVVSLLLFFAALVIFTRVPETLKRIGKWFFYLLIASFLTVSLLAFINIDKFVLERQAGSRANLTSRLCIWQETKDVLKDSPVLGVGLSGFPKVYPKFATCEKYPYQYPHNIFLNFWTEVGLAGLLVFLFIIYRYWKMLAKYLDNFIVIGLFSVIIYTVAHGLVDVPYFKNDLSSQFWVFLAIATWFKQFDMGRVKKATWIR